MGKMQKQDQHAAKDSDDNMLMYEVIFGIPKKGSSSGDSNCLLQSGTVVSSCPLPRHKTEFWGRRDRALDARPPRLPRLDASRHQLIPHIDHRRRRPQPSISHFNTQLPRNSHTLQTHYFCIKATEKARSTHVIAHHVI